MGVENMWDETEEAGALWYLIDEIEIALEKTVDEFNWDFTNQYHLRQPSFQLVPMDSMHPTGLEIDFESGGVYLDLTSRWCETIADEIKAKCRNAISAEHKLQDGSVVRIHIAEVELCVERTNLSLEAANKISAKIAGGVREKLKLSAMYTIHVRFL